VVKHEDISIKVLNEAVCEKFLKIEIALRGKVFPMLPNPPIHIGEEKPLLEGR